MSQQDANFWNNFLSTFTVNSTGGGRAVKINSADNDGSAILTTSSPTGGGRALKVYIENSIGGGTSPADEARITNLENNVYKITYFESVSAATGSVTKPVGSTILTDQFAGGVDAYVSTIVNGQPTGIFPVTAGGGVIDVTSFDTAGAYVLSGTPSAYPVAIIYLISIPALYLPNAVVANRLDLEETKINGSGVANEITYWSNAATLGSLSTATYPSLTELSYIKGLTGSIQPLLDTVKSPVKNTSTITHTGTLVETKIFSQLITASFFEANDIVYFFMQLGATVNANVKTFRVYFNNTDDLVSPTLVGTCAPTTTGLIFQFDRNFIFKNSISAQDIIAPTTSIFNYLTPSSSAHTNLAVDFSQNQYFIVSAQLANTGDTAYIYGIKMIVSR